MNIVLSHYQASQILQARQANLDCVETSLDLGLTNVALALDADGVKLPNGQHLAWQALEKVVANETSCFELVDDADAASPERADTAGMTLIVEKIQQFSPEFNRVYTLMPTPKSPTMLISGIPMHRIKDTNPQKDTQSKVRAAGPFAGPVLDTATGLGYTAVAIAKSGVPVTTIELDPTVLEICRANPWSQGLFDHPNITQCIGDSYDVVETFADESFSQVLHDPPMFGLAGHLYSTAFYRELWRILKPRGRLFHYIGNPDSKSGRSTTKSVLRRLEEAGFNRIRRRPQAFGVVAFK